MAPSVFRLSGRRGTATAGLVAVAAGIALAGLLVALGLRAIRHANDEVQVTGSSKRAIVADFVVWRAQVGARGASLPEAYREGKRLTAKLVALLKARGVVDSTLTVRSVETTPVLEYTSAGQPTGRVLGYDVRQTVEVRSAEVERTAALSEAMEALLTEGIEVLVFPPEYLYTRLGDLRLAMLGEATKDAQARAEAIAGSVGRKVGAIRSARMGVFQVTPRNSVEVSDYGVYDTSSRDKEVTAVVRVTFAVD